jgi:hypothetical protein
MTKHRSYRFNNIRFQRLRRTSPALRSARLSPSDNLLQSVCESAITPPGVWLPFGPPSPRPGAAGRSPGQRQACRKLLLPDDGRQKDRLPDGAPQLPSQTRRGHPVLRRLSADARSDRFHFGRICFRRWGRRNPKTPKSRVFVASDPAPLSAAALQLVSRIGRGPFGQQPAERNKIPAERTYEISINTTRGGSFVRLGQRPGR